MALKLERFWVADFEGGRPHPHKLMPNVGPCGTVGLSSALKRSDGPAQT